MDIVDLIVRDVAELPDRTSPDDWPEAMIVTATELRQIIRARLEYVNREGWRLVPITPTPAMYEAFNGVSMDMSVTPNQFKVGYEAMLAAAPKCEHGEAG
jgi:L-aminopeptidase/D-esterase-like protein